MTITNDAEVQSVFNTSSLTEAGREEGRPHPGAKGRVQLGEARGWGCVASEESCVLGGQSGLSTPTPPAGMQCSIAAVTNPLGLTVVAAAVV